MMNSSRSDNHQQKQQQQQQAPKGEEQHTTKKRPLPMTTAAQTPVATEEEKTAVVMPTASVKESGEEEETKEHIDQRGENNDTANKRMKLDRDNHIQPQEEQSKSESMDIRMEDGQQNLEKKEAPKTHQPPSVEGVEVNMPAPDVAAPYTTDKERKTSFSSPPTTGRWTHAEHQAFLDGLRECGREWKKVAMRIPTRTSAQITSGRPRRHRGYRRVFISARVVVVVETIRRSDTTSSGSYSEHRRRSLHS